MSGQERSRQMSIPATNAETKTISGVCRDFSAHTRPRPAAAGSAPCPVGLCGGWRRPPSPPLPSPSTERHRSLQEYFICLTAGCNNTNLPKLYTSRKVIGAEQRVL